MSRSYKKPYSSSVTYISNKKDKKLAHHSFRAKERMLMINALYECDKLPIKMYDVSNIRKFMSDGKKCYQPEFYRECKERFGFPKWFNK